MERLHGLVQLPHSLGVEGQIGDIVHPDQIRDLPLASYPMNQGLTIEHTGRVGWTRRFRGQFAEYFQVANFPFDRQKFTFVAASHEDSKGRVVLVHDEAAHRFTGCAHFEVPGWDLSRMSADPGFFSRFDGSTHSKVTTTLRARRQLGPYIPAVFLPLAAVVSLFMSALL